MRWTPGGESSNIEDRRGQGGGFMPGGKGVGIGGAVVLLVLSLIFGRDFVTGGPTTDNTGVPATSSGEVARTPAEDRLVQFVSFVLVDGQDAWRSNLHQ